MYTTIVQQISNHPSITSDRVLLFCRCYYVDSNGNQIESIPEKLYTFSTFDRMVDPTTGIGVHKDPVTQEYPVGSISYNDYLSYIPNTLPGTTTTYGNIMLFAQMRVAAIDAEGEFN